MNYIINGSRPGRFRNGANAPLLPSTPLSVEANRDLLDYIILLKALYLQGYGCSSRLLSSLPERAGLLSFPALSARKSRLLPPGASLWLLPAGSGTFMFTYYSCGLVRVHNVEACFPCLWQGKLDLSNTLETVGSLSFPKPPREESSFAAFCSVLDGNTAPGKGRGGTLQGSVCPCSARCRTGPSKEACRALLEARFLSNRSRFQPAPTLQSFGLGGPRGPVPVGSGRIRLLSRIRQDPAPSRPFASILWAPQAWAGFLFRPKRLRIALGGV